MDITLYQCYGNWNVYYLTVCQSQEKGLFPYSKKEKKEKKEKATLRCIRKMSMTM